MHAATIERQRKAGGGYERACRRGIRGRRIQEEEQVKDSGWEVWQTLERKDGGPSFTAGEKIFAPFQKEEAVRRHSETEPKKKCAPWGLAGGRRRGGGQTGTLARGANSGNEARTMAQKRGRGGLKDADESSSEGKFVLDG